MSARLHVIDVSSGDFADRVVAESSRRPVLVDFWAAWCGPCRALGPVLERLADEYAGRFLLAKVDTEANQDIARQFGIRGIPAVKLFSGGAVVDEFVGALPESVVRDFLAKHVVSERAETLERVRALRQRGDLPEARELAAPLLRAGSADIAVEAAAIELVAGNYAKARELAEGISLAAPERDLAQALIAAAELGGYAAEYEAPGDDSVPARFARGCAALAALDLRPALELLLTVVRDDRQYRDDGARKAMLAGFTLASELAGDPELAREYRRRLTILI